MEREASARESIQGPMNLDMSFSLRLEEKAKVYMLGFPWEWL